VGFGDRSSEIIAGVGNFVLEHDPQTAWLPDDIIPTTTDVRQWLGTDEYVNRCSGGYSAGTFTSEVALLALAPGSIGPRVAYGSLRVGKVTQVKAVLFALEAAFRWNALPHGPGMLRIAALAVTYATQPTARVLKKSFERALRYPEFWRSVG